MLNTLRPREQDDHKPFIWSSLWTAARGEQVINCELIVAETGAATLRCGYGTGAVIRSQYIASAGAAAEVAETWKSALLEQGFRVMPRISLSLSPMAVRAASTAETWGRADGDVAAIGAATVPEELAGGMAVPPSGGSARRTRALS